MIPSSISRIVVDTGNILNCKEFNKRATQSPSEEVFESVNWILHSCLKSDNCKIMNSETLKCAKSSINTQISKEERVNLKLTVKIFMRTYDIENLKEALSEVMTCLGVDFIDSVILALPTSPPTTVQLIQLLWTELEKYVRDEQVVTIGVSDLDTGQLTELYNWSQVKPSVNQVNLESCCVMPPEMTAFAKENDIQLLTHNDPKDILPHDSLASMMKHISSEPESWRTSWAVRYSVVVKCRGIIQNKGYLLCASKEFGSLNGPC